MSSAAIAFGIVLAFVLTGVAVFVIVGYSSSSSLPPSSSISSSSPSSSSSSSNSSPSQTQGSDPDPNTKNQYFSSYSTSNELNPFLKQFLYPDGSQGEEEQERARENQKQEKCNKLKVQQTLALGEALKEKTPLISGYELGSQFVHCADSFVPYQQPYAVGCLPENIYEPDLNPRLMAYKMTANAEWNFYKHMNNRDLLIQDSYRTLGPPKYRRQDPYLRPISSPEDTLLNQIKCTGSCPPYLCV